MKHLLAVLLSSALASAVCVNGHLSVKREYSRSHYVSTADVISASNVSESKDGYYFEGTNYKLRTIQTFKGQPPETFTVFSENSSGRFDMAPKERYLIFVYLEHGRLHVDNCGNSDLLSASSGTLAKIQNLVKH
jgi:hypothetical protein